ncbi:MAG: hypothetical protein Q9172_003215 [Xanthocarpia lactea]
MHLLSTTIFISILALLFASPAAALGRHKSLFCYRQSAEVPTEDMQALITNFETVDPDQSIGLAAMSYFAWPFRGMKLCVFNRFNLHNTHLSRKEAGKALQTIFDNCCDKDEPWCVGGYQQWHGDSGLYIDVRTTRIGLNCED